MKKIFELILLIALISPLFFMAFGEQMGDLFGVVFGADWFQYLLLPYALIFLGALIYFVVPIFSSDKPIGSDKPKSKSSLYATIAIVFAILVFFLCFFVMLSANS